MQNRRYKMCRNNVKLFLSHKSRFFIHRKKQNMSKNKFKSHSKKKLWHLRKNHFSQWFDIFKWELNEQSFIFSIVWSIIPHSLILRFFEIKPFATLKWPSATCGKWRMGWTNMSWKTTTVLFITLMPLLNFESTAWFLPKLVCQKQNQKGWEKLI
jgi:hypothetical protein